MIAKGAMMKKLHGVKDYSDPVPHKGKWGQAESLEHWVVLMHKWAEQVTRDIRRIKACEGIQECLAGNKDMSDDDLRELEESVNPDDPPQPPWGLG
jgi:hypothetical protein